MRSEITRRTLLRGVGGAIMGGAAAPRAAGVDYALARHREEWLHHPVLGDPSWDTFTREPGNPILTGSPPYAWPVNGFLFRDPRSGRSYCYVSVYPRGYFATPRANTRLFRERAVGDWEDLGLIFGDPQPAFVRAAGGPGATTDACVAYDAGRYHLAFGWADAPNKRGGLGYASAERPEGPWVCAPEPLYDDAVRKPVLGVYVRAYASTLLKRRRDWLILHMMSTPGNGGGTWGLFAMTAPRADGPYGDPVPLLLPQQDTFHPPVAEFFPAFVYGGRVYAPATSVALNRTFQSVFSAPLEEAHRPGAWRLEQYGSAWHAEPVPSEAQGIWGQTFSGQVMADGTLRAMFPSKTTDDFGTIGLARRPWRRPYQDGFVLSACRGPALASLRHAYGDFEVSAEIAASRPYAICFGCRGPLGPDRNGADSTLHRLVRTARIEWRRLADAWSLVALGADGRERTLGSGGLARAAGSEQVAISRRGDAVRIVLGGRELFAGVVAADAGRIELLAESGVARVSRFAVNGAPRPASEAWLATEALIGAAAAPGEWEEVEDGGFRYGTGFASGRDGARAKWNYIGGGFRLLAPRGPAYSRCTVTVDGREQVGVDLSSASDRPSAVVLQRDLPRGYHAVVVVARDGRVPLDALEVDA